MRTYWQLRAEIGEPGALYNLPIRLGVIIGMISLPLIFMQVFDFFLGDCFWETGCGNNEYLIVFGLFLVSVVVSCLIGWLTRLVVRRIADN
jgi:hypothetical protein